MPEANEELFSEVYGPYSQTTFAIFERVGDGFCLGFDSGPDYDYPILNSDSTVVYKFPSGSTFQLRVTRSADRSLQFHGAHLPTAANTETLAAGPVPVCGSELCTEVIPCPDPAKRIMICTGGIPRCVSSL